MWLISKSSPPCHFTFFMFQTPAGIAQGSGSTNSSMNWMVTGAPLCIATAAMSIAQSLKKFSNAGAPGRKTMTSPCSGSPASFSACAFVITPSSVGEASRMNCGQMLKPFSPILTGIKLSSVYPLPVRTPAVGGRARSHRARTVSRGAARASSTHRAPLPRASSSRRRPPQRRADRPR